MTAGDLPVGVTIMAMQPATRRDQQRMEVAR